MFRSGCCLNLGAAGSSSVKSLFHLELAMQPACENRGRSPVGVVGRVYEQLIVGGEGDILVQRIGVVGLENLLGSVVELTIADQQANAAGGEEVAMRRGKPIDGAADTDGVVWSPPIAAFNGDATRQAAVDIGE